MESYVEISYLIQVLTMMISCMIAGYLSLQPLSIKQVMLYSCMLPLFACGIWITYSLWLMAVIEVLFFLLFFKRRWKTWLYTITLRLLFSLSWYAWFQGGFHNFQYFFPTQSPMMILFIELILLWLLYRKWNYWIGKLNYVYDCKLYAISSSKWWKGYLDSGNMLMLNDVPVIFIDDRYQTYFMNENIQYVVMNTLGAKTPIACYESMIQIRGFSDSRVLVCCQKNVQLPMHCQVLLNVNLWMG